ncbi:MAG TPA: hypothetical protein VHR45_03030 [Thermoanaerobaculia bacterium]|nr:hypothetical protein [Thermoanaerobaculia bacterium]
MSPDPQPPKAQQAPLAPTPATPPRASSQTPFQPAGQGTFQPALPAPYEEPPSLLPPVPPAAAAGAPAPPPAPPLEEILALNLARRPFVNSRPVTRAALLIWLAGALLLALNVLLFRGFLESSQETRTELAKSQAAAQQQKQETTALEKRLAGLQLEQQNREVTFLNRKIDDRTFSWSVLFDRIATVMPDGVRLLHLRPEAVGAKDQILARGAALPEAKPQPVSVMVAGEAKNDEALLQFVQNLFVHSYFDEPYLLHEDRGDDNLVRFDLTVQYLPGAAAPAAAVRR